MYLSQLFLNIRDRAVRRYLADAYELHKLIWNAFPGQTIQQEGRVLYRIDTARTGPMLLVQSIHEPDWSHLPHGFVHQAPQVKELNLSFTVGQRLRFRLRANPTKRVHTVHKRNSTGTLQEIAGKRIALLTEHDQITWLLNKAKDGGFSIPGEWVKAKDPETQEPILLPNFRVDAIPDGELRDVKAKGSKMVAIRFEGVLIVTDPVRFQNTLSTGIGSAKGFGFGLFSLASA